MVERELAAAGLVAGAVAQVGVRVRPPVRRAAAHRPACAQLRGLLGGAERKNGWHRAEEAAARQPRAIQRGLDRSVWDADAVRDERRASVMAALGAPDGVLVVDEPGFLKQGTQSAAVPRQHSGTAGRIANCQIGVFLGSASSTGRAGRDRALYLPQEWADDPDRRAVAGIPAAGRFQPTPQPALRMLERARDTGVPAAWVTAAAGYGNASAFRAALAARGQAQVLAVQRPHTTSTWPPSAPLRPVQVAAVAAAIADEGWRRLRCGAGAHGERIYAWAFVPPRPARRAGWVLALLGRRQPTRPEEP